MKDISIVAGPASYELSKLLANKLDLPLYTFELKTFPDGESKLTLRDSLPTKEILLIQSTYPPVDTHWMQLFFMLDYLSDKKITLIVPYFGYARQDKEFLKGEVVSLKVIANLLSHFNLEKILTLDFHNEKALNYFKLPVFNLSTTQLLADYARKNFELENSLCASPDLGGSIRVKNFSDLLNLPNLILEKYRDRVTGEVTIKDLNLDLSGKNIIIIDDIISTGSSLLKATKFFKERGARRVYA
ncbi:Ribose-phosphate pyrophosphokinase [archaeon HR06]|nr:Ribose-phosphate pyrophosphokinase [archaeon HR06]